MSRSKKGGVNGRRKNALVYLEKKLSEWKTHEKEFVSNNMKGNRRSHEAEQARLEQEIINVKSKLKMV